MKSIFRIAFILIMSCFVLISINCGSKSDSSINQQIISIGNSNHFSGAILCSYKNEIIIDTAFGFANINTKQSNTANTIFPIASITKLFVKQATLLLIKDGKINEDNYLSDYNMEVMHDSIIQIKHLLKHSSGLPDIHNIMEKYDDPYQLNIPTSNENIIKDINSFKDLDFKPGTQIRYSNSNYLLLAMIIEQVSHKCLDKYLMNSIFKPFNMDNTGLYSMHSLDDTHAKGYIDIRNDRYFTPEFNFRHFWGSGNGYSTTSDLNAYAKMCHTQLPSDISKQLVQHNGLYHGYRTYFKSIPELDFCLVILSNNSNNGNRIFTDTIYKYVFENLINLSDEDDDIVGNYQSEEGIYIDIISKDNGYLINNNPIKKIDSSTFAVFNNDIITLTFDSEEFNHFEMNDNGLLISFRKIKDID